MAFVVAALATFRLARMVAEEEGPFSVFVRLRGALDPDQQTWIGRGVNCPLCVGVWAALLLTLFLGVLGYADLWAWPIVWLGLAGAQVALTKWEQSRYRR